MTLGSHQKTVGDSQNWITPKWIIGALGPFDLDPAGADPRPWDCANRTLTQNGLSVPWEGRVWLNPPFDRYVVGKWIAKLQPTATASRYCTPALRLSGSNLYGTMPAQSCASPIASTSTARMVAALRRIPARRRA
jgi:hypothetical protein